MLEYLGYLNDNADNYKLKLFLPRNHYFHSSHLLKKNFLYRLKKLTYKTFSLSMYLNGKKAVTLKLSVIPKFVIKVRLLLKLLSLL